MSKWPMNEEMERQQRAIREAEYAERRAKRLADRGLDDETAEACGSLAKGLQNEAGAPLEAVQALTRALEAGGYDLTPGELLQGSALKVESLDATMEAITFDTKHIKLGKAVENQEDKVAPIKAKIYHGAKAKIAVDGKVIGDLWSDFSYEVNYDRDRMYVLGKYEAVDLDLTPPVLTMELMRKTKAQIEAAMFVPDRIIVDPKVLEAYQRMHIVSEPVDGGPMPAWGRPVEYVPTRMAGVGYFDLGPELLADIELEETPRTEAPQPPPPVRAAKDKTWDERVKEAQSLLVLTPSQKKCYLCDHPKRTAYPHKVHKLLLCVDCATRHFTEE